MAIRFDNSADGLVRANPNLGPTDQYTVAFWLYLVSDQNFYNALWSVNTNDSATNFNLDVVLLLDDGVSLGSYVGNHLDSGFSTPGTALALNTWYYITAVRDSIGVNGFKVYCNAVLDTQNAYDCTGRTASFTREEIANLYTGDAFDFNGRMYNFMRWNRVLTAEEIKYQMTRFEPIHRGSTRLWTTMRDRGASARKWDRVQGNYWTADGTLTDESNPPMTKVGGQFKKYFSMPLVAAVSAINVPLFGIPGVDGYGKSSHTISATSAGVPSGFVAGKPNEELATALNGMAPGDGYGAVQSGLAYATIGVGSGEGLSPFGVQVTTPLMGIPSQETEGLPTGSLAVNPFDVDSGEMHGLVAGQLSSGLAGIRAQDLYGRILLNAVVGMFGHDDGSLFGLIHTASVIDVFGVGGMPSSERYGAVLSLLSAGLFGQKDPDLFGFSTSNIDAVFGSVRSGELLGSIVARLASDLHGIDDATLFGLVRTEAGIDVIGVGAMPSGEAYSLVIVELQHDGLRIPRKVSHTLATWEPLKGIAPKGKRFRRLGS